MKFNKEIDDFLSGIDEIDLSDKLIDYLVNNNIFPNRTLLLDAKDKGAKWNTKRNSLVFTDLF